MTSRRVCTVWEKRTIGTAGAVLVSLGLAAAHPLLAAKGDLQEHAAIDAPSPEPAIRAPQTRDAADRERRLTEKGMLAGSPVMIRIFKAESELELWMQKEERFELFASYPVCHWSGRLGPKLNEGDRQSPEGLYSIGEAQLHRKGRWPRSLDIGFPNSFDRAQGRTGSYILVHGGCTSIGCYAMTSPVMEEIYALSEHALRNGQPRIQVHVFPFRMTDENLAVQGDSPWIGFWSNLKAAYDLFERSHIPPRVSVCDRAYVVSEGTLAAEPDNAEAKVARGRVLRWVQLMLRGTVGAATSALAAPAPSEYCGPNIAEASGGPGARKFARLRKIARLRKYAGRSSSKSRRHRYAGRSSESKTRRHAYIGRNARKAYAAARIARMEAYAKRRQATHSAAPSHQR
jgi:murein L,D-transpeptidase YafK